MTTFDTDPRSIYRTLVRLRRTHRALSIGAFGLMAVTDDILIYERSVDDERLIVAFNLGGHEQVMPFVLADANVLVSTHLDCGGALGTMPLRPDEGVVVRA